MTIYRYGLFSILIIFSLNIYAQTVIAVTSRPLFDILQMVKTDKLSLNLIGQYGDHHHKQLLARELIILKQSDYLLYIPLFDDNIAKAAQKQQTTLLSAADMTKNIIYLNKEKTLYDPHIWLSPIIVQDIINSIAKIDQTLIDPHKQQELHLFIENFKQQGEKLQTPRWAVQHQAWRYLEQFFNFQKPLFLSHNATASTLPQNFKIITQNIQNHQIQCLILEQNTQKSFFQNLVKSHDLKIIILDPTGITIKPQKNSLYDLWERYLEAAKLCQ